MRALEKAAYIVAAAMLALPGMAHAASKWLRADTHNFIIYSNGDEKYLREFAEDVERFDAVLRNYIVVPEHNPPHRLTIYMVRDSAVVARIIGSRNVAGFYSPQLEGSYAVANRTRSEQAVALTGTEVLFHEYAHHYMFQNLSAAYPLWLQEGFAEYFSTVTFTKKGQSEVGKPAYHRAYGLLSGIKMPLKTVLTTQTYSELGSHEKIDAFYGRSWLLAHKLRSNDEGRKQLRAYLTDFFSGVSLEDAAKRNFPDFSATDKALDDTISRSFQMTVSLDPIPFKSSISIHPLDAVQSSLIDLRLQYTNPRNAPDARDKLAALAAANPGQSDVWYELAAATLHADMYEQRVEFLAANTEKLKAGDSAAIAGVPDRDIDLFNDPGPARESARQAALSALDKAIAANKGNGRAQALMANLMLTDLEERGAGPRDARWQEVRKHILGSNAANQEDPVPLVLWYRMQRKTAPVPSPTARSGLLKAFNQVPEVSWVRVLYAFDLASQGDFKNARKVIEVIANDAHQGGMGMEALRQLDAMEGKRSPAPGPTPVAVPPVPAS